MAKKAAPNNSTPTTQKPYLKWPGSKTKLIAEIRRLIPSNAQRLIEPFVGSGAVSLNLSDRFFDITMADANKDLILAHESSIIKTQTLIDDVSILFSGGNTKETYCTLREEFNSGAIGERRAALFLYLNRHCFNGLCRYSAAGKFNTPFGQISKPYLPTDEINQFAQKLKNAKLKAADFREIMGVASQGDFIYCDPPYAPLTETANFTAYSTGGFSSRDQKDLAFLAEQASKKGATVAISNHDTAFTREAYKNAATIISLQVSRTIAARSESRQKAAEIIAVFTPK